MLALRRLAAAVLLALAVLSFFAARAAAAGPPLAGVNVHSLWGDRSDADMARELDLARDAGSNVVRVDVGWSSLETAGKGRLSQWYVDKLDAFVNGASARGMKVIATLWSTPCWASSAPASLKQGCAGAWWDRGVTVYPPDEPADYGDIAKWVTARYGTRLAALEVWNEPNLDGNRFWVTSNQAGAYARLLKAAYPEAKQGNAGVPVLAGSLSSADTGFLGKLYANGIQGSYDGLSIHPYNEGRAPDDPWQARWRRYTFLGGMESVHAAQLAAGDTTPLWITEFGWTSCAGDGWCVSEARQADYTRRAFQLAGGLPYVQAATAYDLREDDTGRASFEGNFGLVNRDFSPKPAYAAMREALTAPGAAAARGATARARAARRRARRGRARPSRRPSARRRSARRAVRGRRAPSAPAARRR